MTKLQAAINEAKAMIALHVRGNKPDMSTNDFANIVVTNLLSYGWRPPCGCDNE